MCIRDRRVDLLLGRTHILRVPREEQRENLFDQGLHVVFGGQRGGLKPAVANQRLGETTIDLVRVARCRAFRCGRFCRRGHSCLLYTSTIYQSLFVQGRGALRKELHQALRTGRAMRRPKVASPMKRRSHIPNMVLISERPAEVEDRAVPGHWEGDLILGAKRTCIGTLVERSTRYVQLLRLPDGTAESVRKAMTRSIKTLPRELFRSVTWDQGNEMAHHERFTVDTGVAVYFCDPKSPWQLCN